MGVHEADASASSFSLPSSSSSTAKTVALEDPQLMVALVMDSLTAQAGKISDRSTALREVRALFVSTYVLVLVPGVSVTYSGPVSMSEPVCVYACAQARHYSILALGPSFGIPVVVVFQFMNINCNDLPLFVDLSPGNQTTIDLQAGASARISFSGSMAQLSGTTIIFPLSSAPEDDS